MKNLQWQSTLALAPIFNTPRHMIGYWLIFLGLGISLLIFQIFGEQVSQAESDSLAELLGGEVRIDIGYRDFTPAEAQFIDRNASEVSEQIVFRSMILVDSEELPVARLSNVRAVDQSYPLSGNVSFNPSFTITDFQNRLGYIDGYYGVFFSKELAEYFQIKLNSIVKIFDEEFQYRGVITNTPDFEGGNNLILPSAMISKDAIAPFLENANLLMERRSFLTMKEGVDPNAFKEEAETGFHEAGWQITTTEDFAKSQSALVILAKRLAGVINILVTFAFATALFSVFKTHFVEERATQMALYANGATAVEIAVSYILRLFALTTLTMVMIGLIAVALGYFVPDIFYLSLPIGEGRFNMFRAMGVTSAIMFAIGLIIGLLAYWSMGARNRIWAFILAMLLLSGLIYFVAPFYALNEIVIYILMAFMGSILIFWCFLKIVKFVMRRRVTGNRIYHFALLEYSGKHSAQEYFGSALFANLILVSCFSVAFFGVFGFVKNLQDTPMPTHYIADIQSNQVDALDQMLGENGVSKMSPYPIIRGRLTAVNNHVPENPEHWLFRGDRFFGVDQTGEYGLKVDQDENVEIAMDQKTASELGLQIGDELTLAVLGETKTLVIKEFRESDFQLNRMDFIFLLPQEVLDDWPHIYVFSVNLTEQQNPVIQKIVDQFPNLIVISSSKAIQKVNDLSDRLIRALSVLGLHVIGSGLVALICLAILLKRKDRYDQTVFSIMGMQRSDMRRIQIIKLLINAGLATIATGILAIFFVKYGLNELIGFSVHISIGAILTIIAVSGLAFAMIPSILLLFSRNNDQNAERYIQDYQKLELDF